MSNGLIYIILFFFFAYLFFKFPHLKILIFSPLFSIWYFLFDLATYIAHCDWRICPVGEMVCYQGLFGKGKTLSAVARVVSLYNRYNDKKVYDLAQGKFVTQKVYILSNVSISVAGYKPLTSLAEICSLADCSKDLDIENAERSVYLILIDEASVQLNSRSFKSNISADFLNTLLTSRHYNMSIFYTSQKFSLTDKLFRDVTQTVIDCRKLWRLMGQYVYDAAELENSMNPSLVLPLRKTGFFATNYYYNVYNTFAVVDNLKKSTKAGDMLSESEVLALRSASSPSVSPEIPSGLFGRIYYDLRR